MRLNQTLVAIAIASICGQGVAIATPAPVSKITKSNYSNVFNKTGGG